MSIHIETELARLLTADQHDPFQVLGLHFFDDRGQTSAIIRAFQPHAESMRLIIEQESFGMYRMKDEGLFEVILPGRRDPFPYQFEATYLNGAKHIFHDPYQFLPQLGDMDRYLFNSGTHYESYNRLGAHIETINAITGTIFRVWAPAARRVSVVGNFNAWDGRTHQMRILDKSGIWELFIPGIGQGECYKYEIRTQSGDILMKGDPLQFYGELRPKTASVVSNLTGYQWQDDAWLAGRKAKKPYDQPMSVYEVHPGSWQRDPGDHDRFLTYRELAHTLVPHVKELGFTHIELMPIMEHPLDESWGYQVTGYFSVTSRYGTPQEFMYFVDCCHQNGIGVLLDWVPSHFPADGHSLARFDGSALYEHQDPRQGFHPDWGSMIFNYGRKEISSFLISNALFWLDTYHIDGLRVDAVASMLYLDYSRKDGEWIPNCYGGKENIEAIDFLRHLNTIVYDRFPDAMMIAEESTSFYGVSKPASQGGLGFGFKWNMGWMNDTLSYFSKDPLYRKYHHNALTFSLYYAFSENFILSISHDEIVHGKGSLLTKMPGDIWQKFANLRLFLLLMWTHPGKKLLFMGSEFGQWNEWYCKTSLDWHLFQDNPLHEQLQGFVGELNRFYRQHPPLWEIDFTYEGFQWMDFKDVDNSVISFARFARNRNDHLVCVMNFTPQIHHNYKIGVPAKTRYKQILCSDSAEFGGSGVLNTKILKPIAKPHGEAPYHVTVTLPPLGGIILKPVKD